MKMQEPMYERKGGTLKNVSTGEIENFGFTRGDLPCKGINRAKRRSREIQQSNGGMGMGAVRVIR